MEPVQDSFTTNNMTQKTMGMKKTIAGPNSLGIVYEMPFNEKNLSILYEKKITPGGP